MQINLVSSKENINKLEAGYRDSGHFSQSLWNLSLCYDGIWCPWRLGRGAAESGAYLHLETARTMHSVMNKITHADASNGMFVNCQI